jgi:hypothetical protein
MINRKIFFYFRHEDNIIRNVLNYTIFIKNDIDFKKLNKKEYNFNFDYLLYFLKIY